MKKSTDRSLPTLDEVEMNAGIAVTTTSMRVGWQIAASAALLTDADVRKLVRAQLATIEREIERTRDPER